MLYAIKLGSASLGLYPSADFARVNSNNNLYINVLVRPSNEGAPVA